MLQEWGLLKESVAAIIMLYKNTKVMVRSFNGNTDFDIFAGVLQVVTTSNGSHGMSTFGTFSS